MNFVTLDLETFWTDEYNIRKMKTSEYILDPRFRSLGLAVKVNDKAARYFDDVAGFFTEAKPFIEQAGVLAHHAHFDGLIMNRHYKTKPARWYCTLSMARCTGLNLELQAGGSLGTLMRYFELGEKAPLSPDSPREEVKARAISDVEATYEVFKRMIHGVPQAECDLIDWTVRCFTEPVLRLNLQRAIELERMLAARKQKILDDLGVDRSMLMSDVQLAALFRGLGIEPPTKVTPKGNTGYAFAKTDKAMQELVEHEDETVAALAAARLDAKSTGDQTRVQRLISTFRACGRLPVYLNHAGAHTLRWSGGDGQNWQNFSKPRKDAKGVPVEGTGVIRRCIEAPPGSMLVVGDLSQIEARITAWLAGQWDLVAAFAEGRDTYCEFGTDLYGRPITKADTLERFVSKTAVLGAGFGCGADRFKDEVRRKGRIEITQATAKRTIYGYRERYAQIPRLWNRCEHLIGNEGARVGPVVSEGDKLLFPDGMYVYYHGLQKGAKGEWSAMTRDGRKKLWGGYVLENAAQRLARMIAAGAILELRRHYPVPTMSHDELVMVTPEADADEGVKLMTQQLTWLPEWAHGWGEHNIPLPLACEVHAAKVYGEAK